MICPAAPGAGHVLVAVVEHDGRIEKRFIREGDPCPKCRKGVLKCFIGPDDHEPSVICSRPGCSLQWEVLKIRSGHKP